MPRPWRPPLAGKGRFTFYHEPALHPGERVAANLTRRAGWHEPALHPGKRGGGKHTANGVDANGLPLNWLPTGAPPGL